MIENINLIKEIKLGNKKALDQFIKQNLNLVICIARDYTSRGVEFEDLVQEGMIGLYKSIYKFDPSISPKFSAYASYWINKCMIETIQKNSRLIYVPKHINKKITNLKHIINELSIRLNRYPTLDEIIEETGLTKSEITLLHNYFFHTISTNQKSAQTLNEEGFPNDEIFLEDLIITNCSTLDEKIEQSERRKKVLELIENSNLSDKAIKILKLRYGFYNGVIYTYPEIAKMMGGVSPQAIQDRKKNSIEKLKKNKRFLELAIYLDRPESEIKEIKKNLKSKSREVAL